MRRSFSVSSANLEPAELWLVLDIITDGSKSQPSIAPGITYFRFVTPSRRALLGAFERPQMRFWTFFLLLIVPALGQPGTDFELRVALVVKATQVGLAAPGGFSLRSEMGKELGRFQSYRVTAGSLTEPLLAEASGGVIKVEGRPYRGRLRVIPDGGGLTVVNLVPSRSMSAVSWEPR